MPIKDQWAPVSPSLSDPAYSAASVSVSDSSDLDRLPRALYIGVEGDVRVLGIDDDDSEVLVFKNVPAGTVLPFRARRILSTGTTATDIVALF